MTDRELSLQNFQEGVKFLKAILLNSAGREKL